MRKDLTYACRDDRSCIIDKRQRNRCQYCRYMKCLAMGMKREGELVLLFLNFFHFPLALTLLLANILGEGLHKAAPLSLLSHHHHCNESPELSPLLYWPGCKITIYSSLPVLFVSTFFHLLNTKAFFTEI